MYDERIDGAPVVADEGLMVPAEPMGKVVVPKIRYTTDDVTASDYNARAFACPVELSAFKKNAWYSVIINGIAYKGIADVYDATEDYGAGADIHWGAREEEAVYISASTENGGMEIWFYPIVLDEAWEETGITVEIREAKVDNIPDTILVDSGWEYLVPVKPHIDGGNLAVSTN